MPLKWFRSHRRSSTSSTEDEATRSSTETPHTKQKAKRSKAAATQRSRRSHSQGSGLRAMIGLGGSMQHELDAAAAVAAEEQRRISYQAKTRRRFTVHGLSYHAKHNEEAGRSCSSTPAGSPLPMHAPMSPSPRHFGFGSSRVPHGRSPRAQQMSALTPDSHPSIIFIDCPP
ncbi:hypothetical protein PHYPSEUDO_006459 [Phytophthora pseudosyringae]|uniref:Uncharacterized protein n=1 Tax=Phytophthora pseudosyringae TaxID=221518 RepID=A0A8T1VNZ3_9STRA|nr:hypothetical protein PHYPSEUDO_006459 [Phytophthora pseudosyringae]